MMVQQHYYSIVELQTDFFFAKFSGVPISISARKPIEFDLKLVPTESMAHLVETDFLQHLIIHYLFIIDLFTDLFRNPL